MPDISVIICTHNPRPHYLRRVLDALKAQTLPMEKWELLLIDNASREPLSTTWDLSWHSHARHVREDETGLTPARLRGIRESVGEYLVFVDDDNVLEADYLAEALSLFQQWPQLGAIGSGISKGDFETPPPDWLVPSLHALAVSELDRSYWSNCRDWSRAAMPVGAGLCVRRFIAEDYVQKVKDSALRRMLGRSGIGLGSAEDTDLVLCVLDHGMGMGRFVSLKFTHLIPNDRMTEDYFIRLHAGFAASLEILSAIRNDQRTSERPAWKRKVSFVLQLLTLKGLPRKVFLATEKARSDARKLVAAHQSKPSRQDVSR